MIRNLLYSCSLFAHKTAQVLSRTFGIDSNCSVDNILSSMQGVNMSS